MYNEKSEEYRFIKTRDGLIRGGGWKIRHIGFGQFAAVGPQGLVPMESVVAFGENRKEVLGA